MKNPRTTSFVAGVLMESDLAHVEGGISQGEVDDLNNRDEDLAAAKLKEAAKAAMEEVSKLKGNDKK